MSEQNGIPGGMRPPLVIDDVNSVPWIDSADVVVVGYGGAGIVTSLQAKEAGADVLAIDRFEGGGATAYSGGINYAGGGTPFQKAAGVEDSVDEMVKYLLLETRGVASKETIERFCRESVANIQWLSRHGVPYEGSLYKEKTSYPPDGSYLYYAGNERVARFESVAKPAARGHRPVGKGYTGYVYYRALRASADRLGIRLLSHSPIRRLVVDRSGAVIGVEATSIKPEARRRHAWLYSRIRPVPFKGVQFEEASREARELEARSSVPKLIRARHAVVLSTGGFVYNLNMLREHRPLLAAQYAALMRLGSMGCDGSGIQLGRSVGAAVDMMDNAFVALSISPPSSSLYGIVVNCRAERFINEDAYAGVLGDAVANQPGGKAWLIFNDATRAQLRKGLIPGGGRQFMLYLLPYLLNWLFGGTRRAKSGLELAQKLGLPPPALQDTIATYNTRVLQRGPDPFGKAAAYLKPLGDGPYTAINLSIDNKFAIPFCFTLGGLVVDEEDGAVRKFDGSKISGLYAAGRCAVGLCSRGYISGMSIADCVFSGRRAGSAAARLANRARANPSVSAAQPEASTQTAS
jgi:3-oxo-5alpha-steroid 4-dehydrogenase